MNDMPRTLPDPRYNPRSLEAIEALFERQGMASRWLALCQAAAPLQPAWQDTRFHRDGVELLDGLSPEGAAGVLARLKTERRAAIDAGRQAAEDEHIVVDDPAWVRALLAQVLTPEVERRIQGQFGTHFFVYYVQFSRHTSADTHRPNIHWHRDGGPLAHAKIMMYFNGTEEHGARTEFLDRTATAAIGRAGYAFPELHHRLSDLSPFVEAAGIPEPEVWGPPMPAGKTLVFQPREVLHRLVLPSRAPRYTMTLMLQPSPVSWRRAFEVWTARPENLHYRNWVIDFFPVLMQAAGLTAPGQ